MHSMTSNDGSTLSGSSHSPPLLLEETDEVDWSLLLLLLQVISAETTTLHTQLLLLIQKLSKQETAQRRNKPAAPHHRSFNDISQSLSASHFRRMFRMNQESFERLCCNITSKVGEPVFKSHAYLLSTERSTKTDAANRAMGGILSGEVKLAIMLRLLAGASYLDMLAIYGISPASVYAAFHEAIGWINSTHQFPLSDWINTRDEASLDRVAQGFSEATGGIFNKCIGALDGLAVKIKSPTISKLIPDPGNYFCRKGFYALNVQAICDKSRRVIWVSTGHKGSTHDSTAFAETKLYKDLENAANWLEEKGYFLIGDSAYPILPYFLVPFANAAPQSSEDAFNFWLSNSRIQIECTFGELVMRWGIFWRKLLFNIEQVGKIVTAAMLLHNFLIDERETQAKINEDDVAYFRNFSLQAYDTHPADSNEAPLAVATDNNEPRPRGRQTNHMTSQQEKGKAKRDEITLALYGKEISRPVRSNMAYNGYGQVYFNS